jgi:DNA-binding MarR family transcriptional regulator
MARDKNRSVLLDALHEAMRAFTNQVTFYSEAVATSVGLHPTDLDCLSVIGLEGSVSAGQLADITGLTTGAVTGVIDRLERGGYVTRTHDPSDRRRVVVRPVVEALRPVTAAFAPMIRSSTQMAARYDDDELALITDYVTRSTPMLREETLRLRDDTSQPNDHADEIEVQGTGATSARLRLVSGAARLTVTAVPGRPHLFSAQFSGGRPSTRVDAGPDGDTVVVQYRRSPFGRFRTRGTITLDGDRHWRIETAGGLASCSFDLTRTTIDAFSHSGGMSSVDVDLPRPEGTLRVELHGGVHAVTISRPHGVAATLAIRGGAANVVLDDQRFGAVGGTLEVESPGDGSAGSDSRLEVVVRGGSKSLSVITRPPS